MALSPVLERRYPTPARKIAEITLKPVEDGWIFTTPVREVRSDYAGIVKTALGMAAKLARYLGPRELFEIASKFGKPFADASIYDSQGRKVVSIRCWSAEELERIIQAVTSAGGSVKYVMGYIAGGAEIKLPRVALVIKYLLGGRAFSPLALFRSYRPPRWFLLVAMNMGMEIAVGAYTVMVCGLAPERYRKIIFERFLRVAREEKTVDEVYLDLLDYVYRNVHMKKRAPSGVYWAVPFYRTMASLLKCCHLFKPFPWLGETVEKEVETAVGLSMYGYPKGTFNNSLEAQYLYKEAVARNYIVSLEKHAAGIIGGEVTTREEGRLPEDVLRQIRELVEIERQSEFARRLRESETERFFRTLAKIQAELIASRLL